MLASGVACARQKGKESSRGVAATDRGAQAASLQFAAACCEPSCDN